MMEFKRAILAATLICGAGLPNPAMAQAQPAPAPATEAAPATAAAPAQDLLKAEQLDQLLAPIALYPDNLLAQTLMASTYPLEVVEASRWADENKNLKGDQLKTAVDKQTWDDSVKSLVATPSVLSMMSTKLSWTQKLGDAVLAQQPDVMDSVQRLRTRAQASKKLETTKEQTVSVRTEQNKQVIVIEPAQPDTVYVPYYDPSVVYGAWPYAAYPPYYFPPAPGYYAGAALATGLAFGAGVALGAWARGGYWGGGCGWGNNSININRSTNINNINVGNRTWQHNPQHRQGVRYSNANVANQFGKGNQVRGGAGAQGRMDFRGRGGEQVLRPSTGGPGGGAAGDRGGQRPAAGGGDRRPGAGGGGSQRPAAGGGGQRPSAGTRPSNAGNRGGGQRPSAGTGNRGGGGRENAMSNVGGGGRNAMAQSNRGHGSLGGGGGAPRVSAGGGGMRAGGGGGGGGMRGGGGGGRGGGGGGGGRRSDISLKHDIALLGQLDNGLGFYRFSYNGSDKAYVGVMAQEVQVVMPDAVSRGRDGTLRVHYEMLGLKFQSYDQWIGSGARVPVTVRAH